MRRVLTMGMLAVLLLAPVACGGADPEAAPDAAADAAQEAAPDAPDADASLAEAGDADPAAATADPAAGEDAAAAEAPTLTPEEVELITNFRPPSKGSEDALVTLYEFSDYI